MGSAGETMASAHKNSKTHVQGKKCVEQTPTEGNAKANTASQLIPTE